MPHPPLLSPLPPPWSRPRDRLQSPQALLSASPFRHHPSASPFLQDFSASPSCLRLVVSPLCRDLSASFQRVPVGFCCGFCCARFASLQDLPCSATVRGSLIYQRWFCFGPEPHFCSCLFLCFCPCSCSCFCWMVSSLCSDLGGDCCWYDCHVDPNLFYSHSCHGCHAGHVDRRVHFDLFPDTRLDLHLAGPVPSGALGPGPCSRLEDVPCRSGRALCLDPGLDPVRNQNSGLGLGPGYGPDSDPACSRACRLDFDRGCDDPRDPGSASRLEGFHRRGQGLHRAAGPGGRLVSDRGPDFLRAFPEVSHPFQLGFRHSSFGGL
mmetsp:Transcript_49685/g.140733  ORF Transcript_49685/g.140733 Transcript_49685/m.140733 type:complete len:322 (-) Transcript_49685:317-1282(-)